MQRGIFRPTLETSEYRCQKLCQNFTRNDAPKCQQSNCANTVRASSMASVSLTSRLKKNIEKILRAQSTSKEWYLFRAGRVTASRMKAVCSTPLERPSPSLVKTICYRHTTKFSNNTTRWGCDHEARALQRYCEVSQTTHTNFKRKVSGFTINPNMPSMGASPDSVVSCDCCGIGVVEGSQMFILFAQICVQQ